MMHRNPFACGMNYPGGVRRRPNRWRIKRKGVGEGSGELRGDVSSMVGKDRRAEDYQDMGRRRINDCRPVLEPRKVQEEMPRGARHPARDSVDVLIPNHPVDRLDWIPSNQRSRPLMVRANHLDLLSEALPGTGIGLNRHS